MVKCLGCRVKICFPLISASSLASSILSLYSRTPWVQSILLPIGLIISELDTCGMASCLASLPLLSPPLSLHEASQPLSQSPRRSRLELSDPCPPFGAQVQLGWPACRVGPGQEAPSGLRASVLTVLSMWQVLPAWGAGVAGQGPPLTPQPEQQPPQACPSRLPFHVLSH